MVLLFPLLLFPPAKIRTTFRLRCAIRAFGFILGLCLLPAPLTAAEPAAEEDELQGPTRGFAMDLSPLIGNDGGVRAIAPGCRALAGFMRQNKEGSISKPFAWSRQHGLALLATTESAPWGTASFISDDGAVSIGYLLGKDSPDAGLIWRANASAVVINTAFGFNHFDWVGLSADGRRAAGVSRWRAGYIIDDAGRLIPFPGADVFNPEKWQAEPVSPRPDGSIPDDPFVGRGTMSAMSRNGRIFAFSDDTRSFLTDADRSFVRELKVDGISPADRLTMDGHPAPLDPDGSSGMDLHLPLLQKNSKAHPLPLKRNASLYRIEITHLSYDGTWAAGIVTVRYPLRPKEQAVDTPPPIIAEEDRGYDKEETFVLRWDAGGKAILLAGDRMRPLAISDDGKTILLQGFRGSPLIWREGGSSLSFRDYLAGFGLRLPKPGYTGAIWNMVMSPDGRCFAGAVPTNAPPRQSFLACTGEDADGRPIRKPSWQIPAEYR